jgi:hypothetical protein
MALEHARFVEYENDTELEAKPIGGGGFTKEVTAVFLLAHAICQDASRLQDGRWLAKFQDDSLFGALAVSQKIQQMGVRRLLHSGASS